MFILDGRMEENTKKELESLELMTKHCYNDKLIYVTDKNNEFLLEEMNEFMENHIYSYIQHLVYDKALTQQEASIFMGKCYKYLEDLYKAIQEKERK